MNHQPHQQRRRNFDEDDVVEMLGVSPQSPSVPLAVPVSPVTPSRGPGPRPVHAAARPLGMAISSESGPLPSPTAIPGVPSCVTPLQRTAFGAPLTPLSLPLGQGPLAWQHRSFHGPGRARESAPTAAPSAANSPTNASVELLSAVAGANRTTVVSYRSSMPAYAGAGGGDAGSSGSGSSHRGGLDTTPRARTLSDLHHHHHRSHHPQPTSIAEATSEERQFASLAPWIGTPWDVPLGASVSEALMARAGGGAVPATAAAGPGQPHPTPRADDCVLAASYTPNDFALVSGLGPGGVGVAAATPPLRGLVSNASFGQHRQLLRPTLGGSVVFGGSLVLGHGMSSSMGRIPTPPNAALAAPGVTPPTNALLRGHRDSGHGAAMASAHHYPTAATVLPQSAPSPCLQGPDVVSVAVVGGILGASATSATDAGIRCSPGGGNSSSAYAVDVFTEGVAGGSAAVERAAASAAVSATAGTTPPKTVERGAQHRSALLRRVPAHLLRYTADCYLSVQYHNSLRLVCRTLNSIVSANCALWHRRLPIVFEEESTEEALVKCRLHVTLEWVREGLVPVEQLGRTFCFQGCCYRAWRENKLQYHENVRAERCTTEELAYVSAVTQAMFFPVSAFGARPSRVVQVALVVCPVAFATYFLVDARVSVAATYTYVPLWIAFVALYPVMYHFFSVSKVEPLVLAVIVCMGANLSTILIYFYRVSPKAPPLTWLSCLTPTLLCMSCAATYGFVLWRRWETNTQFAFRVRVLGAFTAMVPLLMLLFVVMFGLELDGTVRIGGDATSTPLLTEAQKGPSLSLDRPGVVRLSGLALLVGMGIICMNILFVVLRLGGREMLRTVPVPLVVCCAYLLSAALIAVIGILLFANSGTVAASEIFYIAGTLSTGASVMNAVMERDNVRFGHPLVTLFPMPETAQY